MTGGVRSCIRTTEYRCEVNRNHRKTVVLVARRITIEYLTH